MVSNHSQGYFLTLLTRAELAKEITRDERISYEKDVWSTVTSDSTMNLLRKLEDKEKRGILDQKISNNKDLFWNNWPKDWPTKERSHFL